MPEFDYEALEHDGTPLSGTAEGESAYSVAAALREKGLRVFSVSERRKTLGFFRQRRALTPDDFAILNEHLLSITKSGLPLPAALGTMAADIQNPRLKSVLGEVQKSLEQGKSLEQALEPHVQHLSPVYLSLIRAGEQTGNMTGVLSLLSDYSKQMLELRSGFQSVLAYPATVLVLATAIFGYLCTNVSPVMGDIYDHFGKPMPVPSRICVVIGRTLIDHGAVVLVAAVCCLALAFFAARLLRASANNGTGAGRTIERMKQRIPIAGPLYTASILGRFSRTLELLLKSEAQVPESLVLAAAATGSPVFRHACFDAAGRVSRGETIADALGETRLFRPSFLWMLAKGEERGSLENAMNNLAESCEREMSVRSKLVLRITGPLCLVVLGLGVFFTMYAMFIPLFMFSTLLR